MVDVTYFRSFRDQVAERTVKSEKKLMNVEHRTLNVQSFQRSECSNRDDYAFSPLWSWQAEGILACTLWKRLGRFYDANIRQHS